jgi:flagellar basal-body rod protein FlgG
VDANGQVVTANGYQLQPSITIPSNSLSVSIGEDGVVSVLTSGAAAPSQVGNIQTVDFINPTGLQPIGSNLFLETGSSGSPQTGTPGLNGLGRLSSGALESSNVNVVEELVNMIETQRAYEMNSKVISTTDQMLQYVSNNL